MVDGDMYHIRVWLIRTTVLATTEILCDNFHAFLLTSVT
jgi:hypothetical protein